MGRSQELESAAPSSGGQDSSLTPDCDRCCGLCCVAPAFYATADFAIEKAAGEPCPNLTTEFRCAIHDRLRGEGFSGCVVYDCFGAGQKVTQLTFNGQDWRHAPGIAAPMFAVFSIMRQLHELLLYLSEALKLPPAEPLYSELRLKLEELKRLTRKSSDTLLELDVTAHKREVDALLLTVGELVRAR